MWLKRHKNVHLHYTPTHASWLSQIEIWFSILTGHRSAAPPSPVSRNVAHIDAFIAHYNQTARPFVWTKSKVHQKRLKLYMLRGPIVTGAGRAERDGFRAARPAPRLRTLPPTKCSAHRSVKIGDESAGCRDRLALACDVDFIR